MVYRAIGIMSGSSLDGLDLAFVELQETAGKWSYTLKAASCYPYEAQWAENLRKAPSLSALDYQLLDAAYGHYIGEQVNRFIDEHSLHYKAQLIASHGHTSFHIPAKKMTAQLGDGAAIAAVTGINVVSDLRAMDIALGGQGAPIVPIGEKLLLGSYTYFLNLGGIANLSFNHSDDYIAYDICPANRVLNMLAADAGKPFDEGGAIAAKGAASASLLKMLNELAYYHLPHPKSLSNDFGTGVVYPLIKQEKISAPDALNTYVEHIAFQVAASVAALQSAFNATDENIAGGENKKILITGGGALNHFLVQKIEERLKPLNIAITLPDKDMIEFKEAVIMALIGILRWREEDNTLASVTGASRNSIGGAVWIGQES